MWKYLLDELFMVMVLCEVFNDVCLWFDNEDGGYNTHLLNNGHWKIKLKVLQGD
jgi:hypothetical protein